MKDPSGSEYEEWATKFDADTRTDDISKDLEKYDELRKAMEKLVPEKVDFVTFWRRYYFLKGVAELEEKRRKELLKGVHISPDTCFILTNELGAATNAEEEVGWDEDSEEEDSNTPNAARSTTTLGKIAAPAIKSPTGGLKPLEPRKSHDGQSQADSDASYDVVSGATSRTPGSPRDIKTVDEESDEDWE